MREFCFDPHSKSPIVRTVITGPKVTRKVRLIFDTGAEMTQLNSARMANLDYTADSASRKAHVVGVSGVEGAGFIVNIKELFVLGAKAEEFNVGVFEMGHLDTEHIDGLLGWDIIRAFHLEMDGPKGLLKVF